MYAHVADQVTAPCGSKLPNRWGLFDVVGNLWEATGDGVAAYPMPGGVPSTMAVRGGGFDSGSNDCRARSRVPGSMDMGHKAGFRVVCGSATPTKESLPDPPRQARNPRLPRPRRGRRPEPASAARRPHGYFGDWRRRPRTTAG